MRIEQATRLVRGAGRGARRQRRQVSLGTGGVLVVPVLVLDGLHVERLLLGGLRRPARQVGEARERVAAGPSVRAVEAGQLRGTSPALLRHGPGRRRFVAPRAVGAAGRRADAGRRRGRAERLHLDERRGGGQRRQASQRLPPARFRFNVLIQVLRDAETKRPTEKENRIAESNGCQLKNKHANFKYRTENATTDKKGKENKQETVNNFIKTARLP